MFLSKFAVSFYRRGLAHKLGPAYFGKCGPSQGDSVKQLLEPQNNNKLTAISKTFCTTIKGKNYKKIKRIKNTPKNCDEITNKDGLTKKKKSLGDNAAKEGAKSEPCSEKKNMSMGDSLAKESKNKTDKSKVGPCSENKKEKDVQSSKAEKQAENCNEMEPEANKKLGDKEKPKHEDPHCHEKGLIDPIKGVSKPKNAKEKECGESKNQNKPKCEDNKSNKDKDSKIAPCEPKKDNQQQQRKPKDGGIAGNRNKKGLQTVSNKKPGTTHAEGRKHPAKETTKSCSDTKKEEKDKKSKEDQADENIKPCEDPRPNNPVDKKLDNENKGGPCEEAKPKSDKEKCPKEEKNKNYKTKTVDPDQDNPCKGVDKDKGLPKREKRDPTTEKKELKGDPCKDKSAQSSGPKPCPEMETNPPKDDCNDGPKMNALLLNFEEKEVTLSQALIPRYIKKDEVMIQVAYAGANLTDIAVLEGRIPSCQEKLIPGREFSGKVCGVGEMVQHVKAGDKVIVSPCLPGSLCQFCTEQKSLCCVKEPTNKPLGVERNGGWTEYCIAPMNTVYKVPEEVSLKQAALLPALAQVMCSQSMLRLEQSQEIVIIGCGLPGLLFAILLKHNNFEKVCICEDNPLRRDSLEELDLCFPIISPNQLCGTSPDVVFSSMAGSSIMQRALAVLKNKGLFVIFGPSGGNGTKPEIKINPGELSRRRIQILGMEGTPANASNVPGSIITQYVNPEKLGVQIMPMADFQTGLTNLSTGDANHILFEVQADS